MNMQQLTPSAQTPMSHTGGIFPLPTVLNTIGSGQDMPSHMADQVFTDLMAGNFSHTQAAAVLMGLHCKGESPVEIASAARAVLGQAIRPPFSRHDVLDIVGTGGDGKFSFNCSTATALVLAGMGNAVVKHGNRSVSSKCGSADVLERLGISLDTAPEDVEQALRTHNFAFLFAPKYHPAFRHIMPVRMQLGVRTLFNLLGPLVNPASPTYRLIGVPAPDVLGLMAGALAELGGTISAVVCGAGGYDELTPTGPAHIKIVHDGFVTDMVLDPADFGFARCTEQDLAIQDIDDGERVIRLLLAGQGSKAMRDMVALNVGVALFIRHGLPLQECMEQAKAAVSQGKGMEALHA